MGAAVASRVVVVVCDSWASVTPRTPPPTGTKDRTRSGTPRGRSAGCAPNLEALGLGLLTEIRGGPASRSGHRPRAGDRAIRRQGHHDRPLGDDGNPARRGVPTPDGFPPEVIEPFEAAIGRGILGNVPASGTEIIAELGPEHLRTGQPIVYTSGDSVFQIACHKAVVDLATLYEWSHRAPSPPGPQSMAA